MPFDDLLLIRQGIREPTGQSFPPEPGYGTIERLKQGAVSKHIQIQAERVLARDLIGRPVERAEIIVQSFCSSSFALLMWYHNKMYARKVYAETLIKLNEDELKGLDYDFSANGMI